MFGCHKFEVDICAVLFHIMWLSQRYRIKSVHISRVTSVYFGSILEHCVLKAASVCTLRS